MTQRPGRPRSEAADQAILAATMQSLVAVGFAGTTMAGIARDAGVSTATLYRRFSSLDDAVIAALASHVESHPVPDTGSLETDLHQYLEALAKRLNEELGTRLLPALLDEARRNQGLAKALDEHVTAPARHEVISMFTRAIERGEMRADLDLDLIVDMTAGPLYLRRLEPIRPIDDGLPARIAAFVLAAIRALSDAPVER